MAIYEEKTCAYIAGQENTDKSIALQLSSLSILALVNYQKLPLLEHGKRNICFHEPQMLLLENSRLPYREI